MKKFLAVLAVAALVAFAAPAFAANPFMDVPAGHWAYDAVAQLAADGVVSGYPDGAFKGAQPATRYEVASVVARALATIDMEKASKQDVEMLKKLVMEFKDELDALGVKVDKIDKRVAVLEDGVGGWKIRGQFRFDAKFADSDNDVYQYNGTGNKNEFSKERFRLYLTKTIDENTSFYAQYRTGGDSSGRMGRAWGDINDGGRWSHLYVDTKLPYDVAFRVGRFAVDFEDDYGFYIDNDAVFGDFRVDGFRFKKDWGMMSATAVVGRNDNASDTIDPLDVMTYALDLHFQPSEKFFGGVTGYWMQEDGNGTVGDLDVNTYAAYAAFSFTPNIALKGMYYFQDLGDDIPQANSEDSPNAWKAILDIKQDALKFTSLWVEYSEQDNTFWDSLLDRYSIAGSQADYVAQNFTRNGGTSKWIFAKAEQKWNDKFSTFLRYANIDFDTANLDDATEFGGGIGYQYTPAIYFELCYDQVDHGDSRTGNNGGFTDTESVIRFRTDVNF
ncbi:MAG: S-layer homology domain-containing protein [Synergistaceae bacterium]|nr:S-layer homology domain-containing protein [Synergistaceae bacterium]